SELPLTSNGKLDRKALPSPQAAATKEESERLRSPIEEILAGIWCEVLRLKRVGRNENFFDLGGHSLLATRVISRIRNLLNIDMPLKTLFENPTVTELARVVEREQRAGRRMESAPLHRVSRNQALPLSSAQQRLWFIDRLQPDSSAYNIPLQVRIEGGLAISVLQQAIDHLVQRHEMLRTRIESRGGEPMQLIDEPSAIVMPICDISGIDRSLWEQQAVMLMREEAGLRFDLVRGPLLRAKLLRFDRDEHLLLIV